MVTTDKGTVHILAALSGDKEKRLVAETLENESETYHIHYLDTIATLDSLFGNYEMDIIVLDFDFQNGALADWLSLWPLPFVILADPDEQEKLREILKDEVSSFLIREPTYNYLSVLPLIIKRVLYYRELQDIQNRHLLLSERRYLELVRTLPDLIYHIDAEGKFVFVNDAVKRMLGYEPAELIGKHFSEILQPEEIEKVSKTEVLQRYKGKKTDLQNEPKLFDERRTGERKTTNLVVRLKHKEDDSKGPHLGAITAYGEISAAGFVFNKTKETFGGTVGIVRDVTETVQREQLLEKTVEEKTALLSEIHHRVNNNLQLILSLINLHGDAVRENTLPPLLREIQAEVHSMALVHEQLYKSESVNKVCMQDYVDNLLYSLIGVHHIGFDTVSFAVEAEDIFLELEKATPVGLILNELISASLETILSEKKRPRNIVVRFDGSEQNTFSITIEDEGAVSLCRRRNQEDQSTGIQLVYVLVEQLEGNLTVVDVEENGQAVHITVPYKRQSGK